MTIPDYHGYGANMPTNPTSPVSAADVHAPVPDTIDGIRKAIGLTRPQMLLLIGAPIQRILDDPDYDPSEPYYHRASMILGFWHAFMLSVLACMEDEFTRPTFPADADHPALISTRALVRITGIGDFMLLNIRRRGDIAAYPVNGRHYYSRAQVEAFLAPPASNRYQHPIASVFTEHCRNLGLSWLSSAPSRWQRETVKGDEDGN